jgi:hypothetical protein
MAGAGCPSDSTSDEGEEGTSGASGGGGAGSGGANDTDGVGALVDQLADVSYQSDQARCECAEEGDEDCPAERVSPTRLECMKQQVLAYADQAKIKAEIECFIESTELSAACFEEAACADHDGCDDGIECSDDAWDTIDDCD